MIKKIYKMLQQNKNLQITFYDENNNLILNENNVQNIDEIIQKYNDNNVFYIENVNDDKIDVSINTTFIHNEIEQKLHCFLFEKCNLSSHITYEKTKCENELINQILYELQKKHEILLNCEYCEYIKNIEIHLCCDKNLNENNVYIKYKFYYQNKYHKCIKIDECNYMIENDELCYFNIDDEIFFNNYYDLMIKYNDVECYCINVM